MTAGRPPENHEFQWAIRDDAIRMNSGCLSTPDLFRPPASIFCIAPPSRHPTRSAIECGLSVMCQKMGCQLAGSVPCLATKIIKSHVVDKARSAATLFVLLARHPERSNHPSQRNTARNGSSATGAAALAKIHGAERAHWIMACRDRVLCAAARAACVSLTRASTPAGFGFEAPTSNCAWEALLMAPTEPGKPRTQPRLAAATARKAPNWHFFIGISQICEVLIGK